jgi:hypothetical protein
MTQYSKTNSRGVTYYLNVKETVLNGGSTRQLYFFSKDARPDTAAELPAGYSTTENTRTGLLFLKKDVK